MKLRVKFVKKVHFFDPNFRTFFRVFFVKKTQKNAKFDPQKQWKRENAFPVGNRLKTWVLQPQYFRGFRSAHFFARNGQKFDQIFALFSRKKCKILTNFTLNFIRFSNLINFRKFSRFFSQNLTKKVRKRVFAPPKKCLQDGKSSLWEISGKTG